MVNPEKEKLWVKYTSYVYGENPLNYSEPFNKTISMPRREAFTWNNIGFFVPGDQNKLV